MAKKHDGLTPETQKLLEEAGELIIDGRLMTSDKPVTETAGEKPEKEADDD